MQRGGGREDARRGLGLTAPSSLPAAGAIVAAGGRGRRRHAELPKQFAALGGAPLFLWSLRCLATCGCDPLVLVVPGDHVATMGDLLPEALEVDVVEGGETRQESVAHGLAKISTPVVVIHDAARPFVDQATVEATLRALDEVDAAVPVVAVPDTIKRVSGTRVVQTVDRSELALVQTPQAFRTEILRKAHERARHEDFVATDDAQLVERYGGSVAAVPGSRRNIKVTYPEDFALAEALMRS